MALILMKPTSVTGRQDFRSGLFPAVQSLLMERPVLGVNLSTPYLGGCQCGNIRYEVRDEPRRIVACHCTECQTQSGSAFGMAMVVAEDALTITRGEPRFYRSTSSTGRAKLGAFCPDCGTRIYHQPEWRKGTISVKPGTLDETGWLRPNVHLWTSSKQDWVVIPEDADAYSGQPS